MQFENAESSSESLNNLLCILTPHNIEMIVYEARLLKIDSAKSLEKCVDVIFENAVNNESQSIFASLCTKLLWSSVHVCKETQKMITLKEQIFDKSRREAENFLEQQTLMKLEESDGDEAESCHRKLRRPIALFRFIGELYLVNFLPSSFLQELVPALLDETFCNESTLETLCALLKIAGEKLEITDGNPIELSKEFKLFEERKSLKSISPHTRFMIEEVCSMRLNRWQHVDEIDFVNMYNLFLCDVEEKLYELELWYGK